MRHTHSLTRNLTISTLRFIKGWHLLLAATFVLLASAGYAAFLYGHTSAFAAPSLGTAQSFAVLGASTVTNTGPTVVTGELGVWPGLAITGFPPGVVNAPSTLHFGDPVAMQAQSDLTVAYNALAGMPCNTNLTGQDLGGLTLVPGVYCFNTSAQLTGTLTLDGQGDPNAVFIFQTGSTLTTASSSSVQVINGGQPCNVFWQVGSSATLGTGTAFIGNILANISITLNTGSSLSGRALARTGAVTMDTNPVARTTCAPTLAKSFIPATINAGGISQLTITLTNPNTIVANLTADFTDNLPTGVVIAPAPNASTTCGGGVTVTAIAGGTMVTLPAGRSIPGGNPGTCTILVDVTAAAPGSYLNTLPAGALQTSNGNNILPASATLTVVCPPIDTTISAPTAVCALSTGNMASVPDAGAGATYNWTIANGTITAGQGTRNITFTAGTTSPVSLNVTVQTGVGCAAMGSQNVTVNPNPTAAAGIDQSLCQTIPGPTVFNLTGMVTNATPGTPTWSVSAMTGTAMASIVSPNSAMTAVNVTGVGTVTLTLTTSSPGCGNATDDVVLTVTTATTAAAGPDQALCPSVPVPTVFTVNGTGGTPSWMVFATTGTAAAIIVSPNSAMTAVNVTGIGTVTLRLTTSSPGCGNATDDVVLTVNPNPTAAAGIDQSLCQTIPGPTVFNLTGTVTNATPGWSVFAMTGTATANIISPNSAATAVNVSGNGTVTLRLTATSNATPSCGLATDDIVLTVTTVAVAVAGPDQALCPTVPGPTVFTVNGTGGTPTWSVFAMTGTATANIVSPTSAMTAVNVTGIGTVTLRLTTSSAGCGTATDDVVLTVNSNPTAAAGPSQTLCQVAPGPTVFTLNGTAANGTPQWSVFGSTGTAVAVIATPNSATTNVNVTGSGTVTLRLTVTSNATPSCGVATSDVVLTINPLPVAIITAPAIVCALSIGNTASVPNAGVGATYNWTIIGGTIIAGQNTRTITWTAGNTGSATLSVTVTTAAGCSASSSTNVTLDNTCTVDVCIVKTGSALVAYETGQFTYTLSVVNLGPGAATGVTVTDTLPVGVTLVSATPSQGTCSGTSTIICNLGNLAAQATATVRLVVRLPMKSAGIVLCNTATITSNQIEIAPANNISTLCVPVEKVPPGPGPNLPPVSQISDQKSGSVLVFPYYTSDAASPNRANTRINITNVENQWSACVHLFFIDGSSCSVADSYLCLTPNQTASFLMYDLDPGTTGYVVAVQVDCMTGCPININTLIGDEYVKLASGHAANLGAEAISGLPGITALCDPNSSTAQLRFDGVMYNQLPRVLALDSIGSRADGNDTLLIINRIGGNLGTGASTLGTIFGILYDDAENALSFQISGSCQLSSIISNNFPRTAPRFETFIPAGRTGWMKLFSQSDIAILGAAINFNPNAGASAGAFNQGHNLHKLTLTSAASLIIPVFPPSC